MTITKEDFQQFAQKRFRDALAAPSLIGDCLKEILVFAKANESEMDDGAKAYYDNLLDGVSTMYEQALAEVADGPKQEKNASASGFDETETPSR